MTIKKITELLSTKDYPTLKSMLSGMLAADIAELLELIDDKSAIIAFRLLAKDLA